MTEPANASPPGVSRIVLALLASSRDEAALDIVRCMSRDDSEELSGLILEETRALEHAASRLAREVVISGGERPLDAVTLTRQLRAQAEAARERFAARALALGIRGRWELARGELLEALARVAPQAETLVLGESGEPVGIESAWLAAMRNLLGTPARSLLLARPGWSTGTGILALVQDLEHAEALLALARRLAARSRSALHLRLASRSGELPEAQAERLAALRTKLGVALPELRVTVDTYAPGSLASAAERARARLIVLPWRAEAEEHEALAEVIRVTRSAVLLVK